MVTQTVRRSGPMRDLGRLLLGTSDMIRETTGVYRRPWLAWPPLGVHRAQCPLPTAIFIRWGSNPTGGNFMAQVAIVAKVQNVSESGFNGKVGSGNGKFLGAQRNRITKRNA